RRFLDILQNYNPIDDEPMWAADHVVAPTPGSAITFTKTANEFAIKGNHLTLVKGNQFDSRTKIDPHKHIHEFLEICDMFKYRDTENEAVRLMMFPLSLTGEAKTWLDELNEGTIETWDELQTSFISRFFPPALFDRLLGEIRAFSQHENESLTDAWLRMKEMPRNCHGHNLSKGNIIKIFYHGLNEITQEVLNAAAGGSSNSDTNKIMTRMDVMTLKMDAQYKEMKSHNKCNRCGAKNMPVKVGKFTFPPDFVILEMEEDSKVPSSLGTHPFMYIADAYDVIDEILEEDFDALLDEGSKILHSIEGTLLEEEIFSEFDEFMAMTADENSESKSDPEEPLFEKITINTDYKIKTSLEEPPTDLKLKPLPDNLEYVFLEEPYFLPVIISSKLSA
ncbi:reverse transcriptase domain-containing protein, partial [Tanacetum coccineum]